MTTTTYATEALLLVSGGRVAHSPKPIEQDGQTVGHTYAFRMDGGGNEYGYLLAGGQISPVLWAQRADAEHNGRRFSA